MRCLSFSSERVVCSGKTVRAMTFEDRSMLPVSAACLVANAMRETLAQLLLDPVVVRLTEPVLPDVRGWRAITTGARIYRTRGAGLDAALVLRAPDARALANAAFGEGDGDAAGLSGIESTVLDRIASALAANLSPVVGPDAEPASLTETLGSLSTYFEVTIEKPVNARIGVALSRDPATFAAGSVGVEDLRDMEVALAVRYEGASLSAGTLCELDVGDVVPLAQTLRGVAYLAGSPLSRGEVGVKGGRYAFAFGPLTIAEGGKTPSP